MKVAIVNPYLDTLGGGERYTMSVAKVFSEAEYGVDLQWEDKTIIKKINDKFGLGLKNINVVPDVKRGDSYDICFWVSDGSIPLLRARNNIIHFQVPFKDVGGKSLLNKMKLMRVKNIICNSGFTKSFIDSEFGVKSYVIYPPVDVKQFKSKKTKTNTILYVGRFSDLLQNKGHDLLIDAFKKFYKKGNKHWELVLAGGSEVGGRKYLIKLKKQSKGYPVKIVENPPFSKLKDYYASAKVFWSASGYGINEKKQPEKVEHFGITVVEAMSAGCIPFVYKTGGPKEIIENGKSGFLWTKTDELIDLTVKVMEDKKKVDKIIKYNRSEVEKFGYESFKKQFLAII
jgi:glycosyltransferase involved in cell wall biosynthesis